jgi:hypothetical protein
VLAIAEMNLEEYPAFRLGRRSRRTELRYTRTRTDGEGRTLEQVWVVRGVEGLGLPGPFEQDLYVALLVLFTEQGLPPDGRIRFTRNRLAQVMGCSNSGRGYELLEQGLSRLAGATVHTEHAFYRPGAIGPKGERNGPAERLSLDFHILEEVRVYERRSFVEVAPQGAEGDGGAPVGARVERGRPLELSVARLGQPLVQSYERRYTKGLDATFFFTLERPLAKRLYRYLDKVRNGRGGFEIGLLALADVLGLEYRYPSDVKDGLAEAHAELQTTGYLAGASYAPLAGGPRAGEKVVYAVQPAFDRRPRRRAGSVPATVYPELTAEPAAPGPGAEPPPLEAPGLEVLASSPQTPALPAPVTPAAISPLQEELERFGVTPARAARLVETYPEGQVAACLDYVRGLLRRPGGTTLTNPAGYLARAIEQGYALPAPGAAPALAPAPAPAETPVPPPVSAAPPPAPAPAPEPPSEEEVDESTWGRLTAALKARLSAATYAAWVRPAAPASGEGETAGSAETRLTVLLPSAYALDRWRRPPLAGALQEAAGALGLNVVLELKPALPAAAESSGAPEA